MQLKRQFRPAVTGAIGLVLVAVWLRNYHSPLTHPRLTEKERKHILDSHPATPASAGPKPTIWQLLRHPLCIGFFIAQLLTDPIAFFLNFWLPDYLHSRGLTMAATIKTNERERTPCVLYSSTSNREPVSASTKWEPRACS